MVTTNTNTYNNLVIQAEVVREVTITGVDIVAGQGLGIITASGKYKDCQSDGADDGSRTFRCVALEDAPASTDAEDKVIPALFAGQVNEDELTWSGTDTLATHRLQMDLQGVYPISCLDS